MSRVTFSPLTQGHQDILRLALEVAGLPNSDLADADNLFFELGDDSKPLGFVGLEGSGSERLLRSLVVLPSRKRQGFGGLLVAHVEAFARAAGVERLHLLTTSAADFFVACGYRPADRLAAPQVISSTTQFASLCPASAAYLVKELA